jgi:excinuclease ABC subunit C
VAQLFPNRDFDGFGPSSFDPARKVRPVCRIEARRPGALRAHLRQACLNRQGVYGMLDDCQRLIYVGKSKRLRNRLLSYFRRESRVPKAGRILRHTRAIVWEYAPSEFAALLRELELIRRWLPCFNVHGRPGRRPIYMCLGRMPAPHVYLARYPRRATLAAYGPLPLGRQARQAARYLNNHFRLRDCPGPQEMVFADQPELFPVGRSAGCLRHEIGTCLGPCLAACSQIEYMEAARGVKRFLEGADRSLLERLDADMAEAARALAFEKAAELRDRAETLRWLTHRLERLRAARLEQCFVYPVASDHDEERWYLVFGGLVAAVFASPARASDAAEVVQTIERCQQGQLDSGTATASHLDVVLLVASWFRANPAESKRVLHLTAAKNLYQARIAD